VFEAQYSWGLLFSTGRTFSRPHENDRARREPRNAIGDAANQVAIQAREAASREHD
jgi:hypothetical protein